MPDTATFKAVLYDLDGTLLNTLGDIASAMNNVLTAKGFPAHPVDAYRFFVGDGMEMLVRRTLPVDLTGDAAMVQECLMEMKDEYSRLCYDTSRPYPGITELLRTLQKLDVSQSVFSNKPHDFTQEMVERYFPDISFHAVSGLRDGLPKKPDPAGALLIAESSGIPPADFFYLGDTATDMKTAISAGMFPAGAAWGFRGERELRENEARIILYSPEEVLPFFSS